MSQVGGREGESFHSPETQRERISALCRSEGFDLIGCVSELNVSGGSPLDQRTGLREAVAAVEERRADVLVVAYFDRLVRSTEVQTEVLRRVEQAGGRVMAADVGEIRGGDDAPTGMWLNAQLHGTMAEYVRRLARDKSREAQVRAVQQGRPPIILPPGLHRVGDRVEIDPEHADTVREAVRMRANGATIAKVRDHLRAHGIQRSYHGTTTLLRNRLLVGEIVFGDLRGEVPAVVDRDTWERAQRASAPRGRKAKSDRLLARLGVLRCGSCGARMVTATANNNRYAVYRCPPTGDCRRRVSISAQIVERIVVDAARSGLDGCVAIEALRENLREARVSLDHAQEQYAAAMGALSDFTDATAVARLRELRDARDAAQAHVDALGAADDDVFVLLGDDWESLSANDKRRCIRATIDRVTVSPASRGAKPADRIAIVYHDTIERLRGHTPPLPNQVARVQ